MQRNWWVPATLGLAGLAVAVWAVSQAPLSPVYDEPLPAAEFVTDCFARVGWADVACEARFPGMVWPQ